MILEPKFIGNRSNTSPPEDDIKSIRCINAVVHIEDWMILQVLANIGAGNVCLNAEGLEVGRVTYTRQLEKSGRVECTG